MLVQCEDLSPAGALDVLALMNNEPQMQRIWRETPDKKPGHQYTCDGRLRLCAQAMDADNNPLRFEVKASDNSCIVDPDGVPAFGTKTAAMPVSPRFQCFNIVCPNPGGATDLTVTVHDLAWKNGNRKTMEELLTDQGISNAKSHAKLKTLAHLLDAKDDRCKPFKVGP